MPKETCRNIMVFYFKGTSIRTNILLVKNLKKLRDLNI